MALTNAEKQKRWRDRRNGLAKTAEAMERVSSKRRGRRAQPVDDANAFVGELLEFRVDYDQRLTAWRKLGRYSDEDRDVLVHALHSTANELSVLAQELAGFTEPRR
jgi:hypothetical protein